MIKKFFNPSPPLCSHDNTNLTSFQLPHSFKKPFSAMFSKPLPLPSKSSIPTKISSDPSKGVLPLPSHLKPILPPPKEGWTKVINKKRFRKAQSPPKPHIKKSAFCGDFCYMAKICNFGDFKCFACNQIGHTSKSCPNGEIIPHISLPPVTIPPSQSPPLLVPMISLLESIIKNMEEYEIYGFSHLAMGNLSQVELIASLEYQLNVSHWNTKVQKSSPTSFFIEFPSEEILDLAVTKDYVEMGTFTSTFERW